MATAISGSTKVSRGLRLLRGLAQRSGRQRQIVISPEKRDAYAESFRLLALNVRKLLEGRRSKAVVVFSAFEGDGRSLVAANLAAALGEHSSVLLAELGANGDYTSGRWFREVMVGAGEVGANGSESGTNGNEFGTNGSALPTSQWKVWLMAQEENVLTPTGELSEAIRKANRAGMYTVIDSPPALASSESYRLAAQVQNVLYVIRNRPQNMDDHRKIRDTLNRLGADIIGLAVNEW